MPDVVALLDELASTIAWPDESIDVTARAVESISARRQGRRWPVVAAAAAVVVIGVGVPAAAHLLHIGGARITLTGDVAPDLGGRLLLGRPTSLRAHAPRPPDLGAPAAAFEGRPEGGYTEVWPGPSGPLSGMHGPRSGKHGPVIITSFPGTLHRDLIEKRIFEGGTLQATTVDRDPAYWISGPHAFLYLDANGQPQEDTVRLSGHALLWTRDGTTYRLESSRSLAESVALAESMF